MSESPVPRVAVIRGDGIGPEVVDAALRVVQTAGAALELTDFDLGAQRYLRTGDVLPDEELEQLRGFDAILLGAVGPAVDNPAVPSGILESGLLLRLRFALDLSLNVRPVTGVPGSLFPGADLVILRENTEGSYAGEGGWLRKGTAAEVATQGSVNTRYGVERCVRHAFELARSRPRRHVTMVHKTNVLTYAGDLWLRVFEDVAAEHPDVETAYHHADAAAMYLATDADRYDILVTDNLFGDILSDLAAAVTGGIGLAASANLNLQGGVSLFEPVHGAAHDIAGSGTANPLATIRSAGMLLEHLGLTSQGSAITAAVTKTQREQGSGGTTLGTTAWTDAVIDRLDGS